MSHLPVASKRYDSVDLAKFILAMMIVLIHVNPFSQRVNMIVMPVLRLAVPLFFLISSYFFFVKVRVGKGASEQDLVDAVKRAVRFTKRNIKLYLFWLVILLVPIVVYRGWFQDGLLYGLALFARHFLLGSTFIASWYIVALIVAVWVVLVASMRLKSFQVVVLMTPFFIVSCLLSNYYYAPITQLHLNALTVIFWYPYNSFWIGLFWVAVGKWICDYREAWWGFARRWLLCLAAVGLVLLAFEQVFICTHGYSYDTDVFFSLPVVVVPLFMLLMRWNTVVVGASFLRAASTVTYCLHATLKSILGSLFSFCGITATNAIILGPVIAICLIATVLILKFENKHGLRWLKFAH